MLYGIVAVSEFDSAATAIWGGGGKSHDKNVPRGRRLRGPGSALKVRKRGQSLIRRGAVFFRLQLVQPALWMARKNAARPCLNYIDIAS